MKAYHDLLRSIIESGRQSANRTKTDTIKTCGQMLKVNLSEGFPLLTTKSVFWRGVVAELLWFLSGDTNNETLREQKVGIWNEWALPEDVYVDAPLQNHERAALLGEHLGISTAEAISKLNGMSYNVGLEYLEKLGIADTKKQLYREKGDLGPLYGQQWRAWRCSDGRRVDQISQALQMLIDKPNSRRILVTAWNPEVVPDDNLSAPENVMAGNAALAACHSHFQLLTTPLTEEERLDLVERDGPLPPVVYLQRKVDNMLHRKYAAKEEVTNNPYVDGTATTEALLDALEIPKYRLNLVVYQRSCDTFLGLPFNIASYALLTHMFAAQSNMVPGELTWMGGDVHLYVNHIEQAELQLSREPYPLPTLKLNPRVDSIFDYGPDDIELENYQHHPAIKAEVAQ